MLRLRVKEVATEQGMSMMDLSRRSYVALGTIRAIYHNPYRSVTTDTLQKLAEALAVPVSDLFIEEDSTHSPE